MIVAGVMIAMPSAALAFRRLPGFEPGGGFLRSGVPFCRPVSGGARITSRVPLILWQQPPVDADLEDRDERPAMFPERLSRQRDEPLEQFP